MGSEKTPRTLGVTLRKDGSYIRIAGSMDEVADYSALLAERQPLRLLLSDVVALNSYGIRNWIRFIREFGIKTLEFHQCPPVFIDAANMIPDVISTTGNMKRIKSVIVPHACRQCRISVAPVIDTADMAVVGAEITIPLVHCPTCNHLLDCEVDPSDHFLFLTCP